MEHIQRVLNRLIEVGLKLKPSKCQFLRREVEFLGHIITPNGLKTSQHHISAITHLPVPQNVSEIRHFMGLTSYYRRFVKNFAAIAQPLHALTRKGTGYVWTEECQHAFEELRSRLTRAPILAYPSFEREFILETDASIRGIGAVLSQQQEDQKLHPVAFASRGLTAAEKNYSITDLETLAVVWSVSHFRAYLYGQVVTIYTDHAAVKAVLQNPNTSGRHARWWLKVHGAGLKEVTIIYRAGKDNAAADALSRSPQATAPMEAIAEGEVQVCRIEGGVEEEDFDQLLQQDPESVAVGAGPVRLAQEQRSDPQLRELIEYMEKDRLPEDPTQARKIVAQSSQFTLVDNVLYLIDKKSTCRRAVAPAHLKKQLIEQVHGGPLAGHFSSDRVFQTLSRSWWCRKCIRTCAPTVGAVHNVQW